MADIQALFSYQKTGSLVWETGRRAGRVAGFIENTGYCRILVKKSHYYIHRLVWVYHNGTIPQGLEIDHIDHDTLNNQIENLRLVTRNQNMQHRERPLSNSGFMGVYHVSKNSWRASIYANGMVTRIGHFNSPEKAARARDLAAVEQHGKFAYLNFPEEIFAGETK